MNISCYFLFAVNKPVQYSCEAVLPFVMASVAYPGLKILETIVIIRRVLKRSKLKFFVSQMEEAELPNPRNSCCKESKCSEERTREKQRSVSLNIH